jgi:hypothetical protein
MHRSHTLALALGTLAMSVQATVAASPEEDAVRQFYAAYQKQHFSGLPDAKQLTALSRHLSSGLKALIRKAQAEQARCSKAQPDEKGPWIEGDMFTSSFEGFTSLLTVEPVPAPKAAATAREVRLTFEYVENGQKVTWKDDVVLHQEAGRWVIDDISYKGGQNFGNGFGSGLRRALAGKGCD